MDKIRVILIEDHTVVRDAFKSLLEHTEDIDVIGEAGDADTAVSLTQTMHPDVIILDLQVPGASGPELCWRVGEASPTSAVVVLTAFLNPHLLKACTMGGAAGYVLKDATDLDLPAVVRRAHSGETVFDARTANMMAALVRDDDVWAGLTRRELQVLGLISQGMTNQEIADELFLSVNTVKGYTKNIFAKTGSRNRTEAVAYVREHNLL